MKDIIPKSFWQLFWNYKNKDIISNLDNDIVIQHVLEFGDVEDFEFLTNNVPYQKIIGFLKKRGKKLISKKSYNFWSIYYDI